MKQETFLKNNGRFLRSAVLIITMSLVLLIFTLTAFGQDTQPVQPPTDQGEDPQTNQPNAAANNTYGSPLPDEMGYQGQLVADNGNPQVGSYTMEFAVLSGPPAYSLLYTETQTISTDPDGLFNVMIGAIQPGLGDALAEGDAWLEIKLDNEILAPRQPVGSVAYALYAQHLIGGTGSYSAIGGGRNNDAGGSESVIAGGLANTASGNQATVSGGWTNQADAVLTTVAGGSFNTADATGATVSGGSQNVVTGTLALVGGGFTNSSGGDYATIGGGRDNDAYGIYATITGGRRNDANGEYATVAGGDNNDASGYYSAIGGGSLNEAVFAHSTVSGGSSNSAWGRYSTIGGGTANETNGYAATVSGGHENEANGNSATVSGGHDNAASADWSTVSGGESNTASGSSAVVVGGRLNEASGRESVVLGGSENVASGVASAAGGTGALALHRNSFVWSGSSQPITTTDESQFLIDATNGVGIGTNDPRNQLHVVDDRTGGTDDNKYTAMFENAADMGPAGGIVVYFRNQVSNSGDRFIQFRDVLGAVGSIHGNGASGVVYNTTGNDFAEYLPLHHSVSAATLPGTVFGLIGNHLQLNTIDADRVFVQSSTPGFVGNASITEKQDGTALVAFMGQARVRVRGPVQTGDLLVASGLNDGTAVAIAPAQLSPDLANQIVGQALESSVQGEALRGEALLGESLVNTLVGLPTDAFWAAWLSDTQAQLDDLAARLTALEAQAEVDHE